MGLQYHVLTNVRITAQGWPVRIAFSSAETAEPVSEKECFQWVADTSWIAWTPVGVLQELGPIDSATSDLQWRHVALGGVTALQHDR